MHCQCTLTFGLPQIIGRLRRPGTCVLFTTVAQLNSIICSDKDVRAKEMAQVIITSRASASLAADCFKLCDGIGQTSAVSDTTDSVFQYDVFKQYCQSLCVQITEIAQDGCCTFCLIIGNREPHSHITANCPWNKKTCSKCFQTGHNRSHCMNDACRIPAGFCVMCLLPVDSVYGIHSGRYGRECANELRDCLKPIVSLLYHSQTLRVMVNAARMMWSPTNPKPLTFMEYWNWLWLESDDHIYGILKVLHAVLHCAP